MARNLGEIRPQPKTVINREDLIPRQLRRKIGMIITYNLGHEQEVSRYGLWPMRAKIDMNLGHGIDAKAGDTFTCTGIDAYHHFMEDTAEFVDADKYAEEARKEDARKAAQLQADTIRPMPTPNPRRKPDNAFVANSFVANER